MAALPACADECFDDGLLQHGCPAGTVGQDGGGTAATDTATATNTATDTDPSAGTADGGGFICPELDEVLLPLVPTLQLVIDQSGSMDDDFGGQSRWDALESTLVAPDGVVTRLQSNIRFGVTLYTTEGGTCPLITEQAPQLDAADEITTLLGGTGPGSETPTGESFRIATASLMADPWVGPKVMVLATDGEPDTCAVPNPQSMQEIDMTRGEAVSAVQEAFTAGIRTFIISVGDQISQGHLQDLANAGVGNGPMDPDQMFFQALDPQGLIDAFDQIVAGLRPCTLDLPMALPAGTEGSCTVTVNGTALGLDDPNGWRVDTETSIELTGTACDSIQEGVVSIKFNCTCVAQ